MNEPFRLKVEIRREGIVDIAIEMTVGVDGRISNTRLKVRPNWVPDASVQEQLNDDGLHVVEKVPEMAEGMLLHELNVLMATAGGIAKASADGTMQEREERSKATVAKVEEALQSLNPCDICPLRDECDKYNGLGGECPKKEDVH